MLSSLSESKYERKKSLWESQDIWCWAIEMMVCLNWGKTWRGSNAKMKIKCSMEVGYSKSLILISSSKLKKAINMSWGFSGNEIKKWGSLTFIRIRNFTTCYLP